MHTFDALNEISPGIKNTMADTEVEPKAESQAGVADLSTADQEASHDGDNKFQKAISAWRSEYTWL